MGEGRRGRTAYQISAAMSHRFRCREVLFLVSAIAIMSRVSRAASRLRFFASRNPSQPHLARQSPAFLYQSTLRERHTIAQASPLLSHLKERSAGAAYHASVNQQLVERRNEIHRQKRQARQKSLDADRERNLKLRHIFRESSTSSDGVPPMFAVKVVACPTLRSELKMNGREKRGRMFVERPQGEANAQEYACNSVKALRKTIHEFFRRLKKGQYILSASLPTLDEEGNVLTHEDPAIMDGVPNNHTLFGTLPLESDSDVQRAFAEADDFFFKHRSLNETSALKRPTIVLHVTKDPDAPLPPPPPPYLEHMADPRASPTMTMLSFYAFPPGGIPDADATADSLRRLWRPFGALGRIYVAQEGVNAQMAIPSNVLDNFLDCCTLPDEKGGKLSDVLGPYMENGINVDPMPVDMAEFRSNPAFKNLHVRVRSQIVADGFETPLDWQSAGYDMPPLEWHQKIKESKMANETGQSNSLPIVLDCRNDYETQVGKFDLAEPLGTTNFRDSWEVLKNRLKDTPKDAPIMTYCTGGIRCVKVNAYLTQELGMTNVSRLAGGVIGYDRTLSEQRPDEEPMFKGVNYVFDGRMGRRITNDKLGTCYTCGAKTHLVTNCKNDNCHRRMVQCEHCQDAFYGTCSSACKTRVVNQLRGHEEAELEEEKVEYDSIDDYTRAHSTPRRPLLAEIEKNTASFLPTGAHMVSGDAQGSLLTTLASMTRHGRVLEIGTFTGYATACFLDGAATAGDLSEQSLPGTPEGGPFVLSLERDRRALGVASCHIGVMAKHGLGEEGSKEAAKLREKGTVDFDGDSVSFTYSCADCELLQTNDALATVEEMAKGQSKYSPFDIVFVDADKTRLYQYVEALVSNDNVLRKGGLILVDNTLWKGLVLDAARGYDSKDAAPQDKKNRRARKLASKMHRFNSAVVKDARVEVLQLSLRDGLTMIRKR